MRAWLLLALVLVPWSGCLSNSAPTVYLGLFDFDPIERGDPRPVQAGSCPELLDALNERALDQSRVALEQSVLQEGYVVFAAGGVAGGLRAMEDVSADGASPPMALAQHSASGAQVTGTNNQEADADEGDLVKTDGEWTYVLAEGRLHILHSQDVGDIAPHATVELGPAWGGELLLEDRGNDDPSDDRLLVVLPGQPVEPATLDILAPGVRDRAAWGGMTRILVLSLEDRRHPETLDDVLVEGNAVGARLVDGHAHVVVHRWEGDLGLRTWADPDEAQLRRLGLTWESFYQLDPEAQLGIRKEVALAADRDNQDRIAELELEDHLPVVLRSTYGFLLPEAIGGDVCRRVLATPGSTGRGFTTVLSFGLDDDGLPTRTLQVMGSQPIVYASGDALVLAAPSQDFWWFWAQPDLVETTDLVWLDLDGLEVTHRASGRVPGIVQDSFGIDVHGDQLRVATTTGTWGRWWVDAPEPMMNHVAVFTAAAGLLVPDGIVGGIAPGERIWAARFTDDRAYLVTFRNMDPLWVIDLEGRPEILGELEIPGVSTYLHPLDDDAILAIGYGPGPDGENLDWGSVEVSLFDISDLRNPRRADVLELSPPGDGWSWSGATQEHRAFTYWDAVGTLAVPLSTSRGYETVRQGESVWIDESHVGLQLVEVDRGEMALRLRGEVDQDALLPQEGAWGVEVQRSYFLGYPETGPVSVYAVSQLGVTSHDLATLEDQARVSFQREAA